jgi:23S rRNA (guanosine2251-2'-O)-methyltransferase
MRSEWIAGKRAIEEALNAGRKVEQIQLAEGLHRKKVETIIQQATEQHIPYTWRPRAEMDKKVPQSNHQGIIARVAAYEYATLDDCFRLAAERKEAPFLLLLDGIEDPHNLGSILRTADAAGVHGVIIPKKRAVGLTTAVSKTSTGAIEYVPVVQVTNLNRTADELKKAGLWLVGSVASASQSYRDITYEMPLALVIGNEGAGISALLQKKCDFLVRLPMTGQVASLNASVAAGILMYEVLHGRQTNG